MGADRSLAVPESLPSRPLGPVENPGGSMHARIALPLLLVATLAGCMAAGPPMASQTPPPETRSPLGSPFSDREMGTSDLGPPLVLDRPALSIGTTVPVTPP